MICSTGAMAFPAYNVVKCSGNVNGHTTSLQYNKGTTVLSVSIDGNQYAMYATDHGDKIVTNSEYDEYGNIVRAEIASNSTNWNATFNIFSNTQLVLSNSINYQRLGLHADSKQTAPMSSMLTTLQKPANGMTK